MSWIPDLYGQLFGRNHMKDGSIIEMAEHGRSGGVSTGQPFKFTDYVPMAVKITNSGYNTYIATANSATTQASASWRAMKIYDTGSEFTLTWADGDTNFNNVATDLTALSYS